MKGTVTWVLGFVILFKNAFYNITFFYASDNENDGSI